MLGNDSVPLFCFLSFWGGGGLLLVVVLLVNILDSFLSGCHGSVSAARWRLLAHCVFSGGLRD